MGSITSKESSPDPRRRRSRVFAASCFGTPSSDPENEERFENGSNEEGKSSRSCDREIELDGASSNNAGTDPSSIRSKSRFGFRFSRTFSVGAPRAQSLFSESNEDQNHVLDCNSIEEESNPVETVEEMRRYNRRAGPQVPLEGNVRFSRTLSVGRLRDRVLRRTSATALLEERFATRFNEQDSERRETPGIRGRRRMPAASFGDEVWPHFSRNHPYHIGGDDLENEGSQLREETSDLLEHGSAFLERRRRIRSQVRALQRLGSRFENLSGHERSCILSGQHRMGRCTCRTGSRSANPHDEAGTRASISRIVMLAEALFEVLDEIQEQSVAFPSRPSFSLIGSAPAPKEVVDCMPVKVYGKPQKHQNEETEQCYICLVEYEDGDFVRALPCNHEFHQPCIDKWLKEIHRVCPLCRSDVCRSEALSTDKIG